MAAEGETKRQWHNGIRGGVGWGGRAGGRQRSMSGGCAKQGTGAGLRATGSELHMHAHANPKKGITKGRGGEGSSAVHTCVQ